MNEVNLKPSLKNELKKAKTTDLGVRIMNENVTNLTHDDSEGLNWMII